LHIYTSTYNCTIHLKKEPRNRWLKPAWQLQGSGGNIFFFGGDEMWSAHHSRLQTHHIRPPLSTWKEKHLHGDQSLFRWWL